MRKSIKESKRTARAIEELIGENHISGRIWGIVHQGKKAFDSLQHEVGRMLVEAIFLLERENISGPDYAPIDPDLQKWGYQGGSVFVGDQKLKVRKPRLFGPKGEMSLPTYEKLQERGQFSDELLTKVMAGLSQRRYKETVAQAAGAFGVSPSSASRHFIEVSAKKLKEFLERRLDDFFPFAIQIDTVHRGGVAFIVALGIDIVGQKKTLGFWEGATENSEIAQGLLADLERRGLKLCARTLFITDGGSGVIKALKEKFGRKLMHQRCILHKERNIERHLAKKYRKEAKRLFRVALAHMKYEDAKQGLVAMEKWLRVINPSAANSLLEAFEEVLLLHKLEVPDELRPSLRTTNGIENLFSVVRHREKNVKNYSSLYRGKPRKKNLSQRWFATVLLNAESGFRKVNGCDHIQAVIKKIEELQTETIDKEKSAA